MRLAVSQLVSGEGNEGSCSGRAARGPPYEHDPALEPGAGEVHLRQPDGVRERGLGEYSDADPFLDELDDHTRVAGLGDDPGVKPAV